MCCPLTPPEARREVLQAACGAAVAEALLESVDSAADAAEGSGRRRCPMHRCPVCNTVTESWGWAGGPGRIGVLAVCPRCGWRGWVETQIEQDLPVRDDHDPPTLTENGVLATLVHPATEIVACPNCGMGLRKGGETEEMVSRKVALNVAAQSGRPQRWACPVKCGECCSRLTLALCAERRLAYAEQQAAGGRPE